MRHKILKNVCFIKCLSKRQRSFRRGCNIQYCLLKMLEKWKSAVDKGKSFGALLADLSKAFDFISHDILLVKLRAYGFSFSALKSIPSYLKTEKKEVKSIQHMVLRKKYFSGYLRTPAF